MTGREIQIGTWNTRIRSIGNSLFTAFFIYILEIIFVLAFTALIYSGELSSQIPRAIGFILFGDAILCAAVAWLSSYPGFIAVEQDTPGAILGVLAVNIIAVLSGKTEMQFATVTLMLVITTMMTGILLLALGYFKLGGLVRFLPYPVIGGFLAGTGWLLIQGGIGIMANSPSLSGWFQREALLLWVPGAILGIAIYFISQRFNKPYIVPLLMLVTSLLFYALTWIFGSSIADLRIAGWLLDPITSNTIWEFPLSPSFLSQVNWPVLISQIPAMAPVALISVIALLLGSSGMEVLIKKDIDLNRELMAAGVGNFFASLAGGLIGYQDVSFSSLSHAMGGARRQVSFFTALFIAATMFIGTFTVLYIPKFVFGSVLIFIGVQLLMDWVYEAWFKFSLIEFLVVVTILIVLALNGILQAVMVGLILAVTMFAISYSQISVIKYAFSGRDFRSRVSHPIHEQQVLDVHGNKLYIMKLEGFIFFGTANAIFDNLRNRARLTDNDKLQYCLMDFSKVSGIDSTGMLSFSRMLQWSQEHEIQLVITGLTSTMHKQFVQEMTEHGEEFVHYLPNLDRGLEWCESELIRTYLIYPEIEQEIVDQLNEVLKDNSAKKLISYMVRLEYLAGEYLIREGGAPDFIYFVHSGQVTAQLESPGQEPIRLETIYSGRAVGELAFYLGTRRTASVIADQDSVVYSLSINDLHDMEANDPETAYIFHRLNVLLLSERVIRLTRTIRALDRI